MAGEGITNVSCLEDEDEREEIEPECNADSSIVELQCMDLHSSFNKTTIISVYTLTSFLTLYRHAGTLSHPLHARAYNAPGGTRPPRTHTQRLHQASRRPEVHPCRPCP